MPTLNFIKPEYKDKYEQLLVVQNVLQQIYSVDRQLKQIRKNNLLHQRPYQILLFMPLCLVLKTISDNNDMTAAFVLAATVTLLYVLLVSNLHEWYLQRLFRSSMRHINYDAETSQVIAIISKYKAVNNEAYSRLINSVIVYECLTPDMFDKFFEIAKHGLIDNSANLKTPQNHL